MKHRYYFFGFIIILVALNIWLTISLRRTTKVALAQQEELKQTRFNISMIPFLAQIELDRLGLFFRGKGLFFK